MNVLVTAIFPLVFIIVSFILLRKGWDFGNAMLTGVIGALLLGSPLMYLVAGIINV